MPKEWRDVLELHRQSLKTVVFRETRPEFEIARFFRRYGVNLSLKEAVYVSDHV